MNVERYLVVSAKKSYGSYTCNGVRVVTNKPALSRGEKMIKLRMELPDALFAEPELVATITIPEDKVNRPVIDAETLDNVKEVLENQTGLSISIALVEAKSSDRTKVKK